MLSPLKCPWCSNSLLCHIHQGKPYWFCRHCHSEVSCDNDQILTEQELQNWKIEKQPPGELIQTNKFQQSITIQEQIIQLQKEQEKLTVLKEDFLNTISHELRTPLSNMRLSIQVLETMMAAAGLLSDHKKKVDSPPSNISPFLTILKEECEKEINLINDLLLLQQLKAETQPPLPIKISLDSWLPQVVETFAPLAEELKLAFQINLLPDLPPLEIDFAMLDRLVKELLTNACKFTPIGETIALTAAARLGWLQLRISNSGIEIPTADLERIFNPFYRVPKQNPWKHAGTGLGLALVKEIVEHLGGSVWVESGFGQTCFVVDLPCPASQELTQLDLLTSYVACYLSRGRTIVSPSQGPLPFEGLTYQYWGYHSDFLHLWRRLQQRRDFYELYLEGDIYNFGQFLSETCKLQECVRCRLPILLATQDAYNAGCPCDRRFLSEPQTTPLPRQSEAITPTRVLAIGNLALTETIRECFYRNKYEVYLVSNPETIPAPILSPAIDLIVMSAASSEAEIQRWVSQLRNYPELQPVPTIALSPRMPLTLPWTEQGLELEDYILMPLGGDRLANYLRQLSSSKLVESPGLYWFPFINKPE